MNVIKEQKKEAYEKAIDALARYKFMMFGYWAAIWIHMNQIDVQKESNPFRDLVQQARKLQEIKYVQQDSLEWTPRDQSAGHGQKNA